MMENNDQIGVLLKVEDKLNKSRHNVTVGILYKAVEDLKEGIDELIEISKEEDEAPVDLTPISNAIDSLSQAIKNIPQAKIDLSPLNKTSDAIKSLMGTIESQNKQLISIISSLQKSESQVDISPLVDKIERLILSNSKAIEMSNKSSDYSKQLSEIVNVLSKKQPEWEFEVFRDQGKIYKIKAKTI